MGVRWVCVPHFLKWMVPYTPLLAFVQVYRCTVYCVVCTMYHVLCTRGVTNEVTTVWRYRNSIIIIIIIITVYVETYG